MRLVIMRPKCNESNSLRTYQLVVATTLFIPVTKHGPTKLLFCTYIFTVPNGTRRVISGETIRVIRKLNVFGKLKKIQMLQLVGWSRLKMAQKFRFLPKFRFLTKISIFDQNFDF